jgi:hypothetical protein
MSTDIGLLLTGVLFFLCALVGLAWIREFGDEGGGCVLLMCLLGLMSALIFIVLALDSPT